MKLTAERARLCFALACGLAVACRRGAPEHDSPASSQAARWGKRPVAPSTGCGKGRGVQNERRLAVGGNERRFLVSLPRAYDGSQPYPLAFAFHGKGRSESECRDVDCRGFETALGERAIRVYMKSLGEGWRGSDARFAHELPFFSAVLGVMKAEYCVDEQRVIVAGTSSGAFFANELACRHGDRLLAVFPVGGGLGDTTACQPAIAAVVLHGIDDVSVPFARGEATRDYYRGRNGCAERTEPDLVAAHEAVRAARTAGEETYRCVDYTGCRGGLDVRWCEHGEGGYDGSTHAWPSFGGKILSEFLDGL